MQRLYRFYSRFSLTSGLGDVSRPELSLPHDVPLLHKRASGGVRQRHNDASPPPDRLRNGLGQSRQRPVQRGEDAAEDRAPARPGSHPVASETGLGQAQRRRRCRR